MPGHLGTVNTASENSAEIEGQAVVSYLADEDVVINLCLQNKIAKSTIDELLKRGFNSFEVLTLVVMDNLVSPKIPVGQCRLILHIAGSLKHKLPAIQLNEGASLFGGTASETTLRLHAETAKTTQSTTVHLTGVAGSSSQPNSSSTNAPTNIDDLFQHISGLVQEQQRLASSNDASNITLQVSWNDPQIHLSSAAGKSTSYLDICYLAQSCVEEEVVLGSHGDQQFIDKSRPKNPRLENMTLSEWSVANLAILYKLVGENKLQGPALMDYLSYTTKIYQLVQRYSLVSVMLLDREYRKL